MGFLKLRQKKHLTSQGLQPAEVGALLPFVDLPVEFAQLQRGGLYAVGVYGHSQTRDLAAQTFLALPRGSRAVFIDVADQVDALMAELARAGAAAEVRGFAWAAQTPRALAEFPLDLDKLLRPRGRLIVAHVSADALQALPDVGRLMKAWSNWLLAGDCTLMLIMAGAAAKPVLEHMSRLNQYVRGAAHLVELEAGARWEVAFWRNTEGVCGPAGLGLARQAVAGWRYTGRRDLQSAHEAPGVGGVLDEQKCILQEPVLEGTPVFMAEDWQVHATAQQVYEQALRATHATVVFALDHVSQVEDLARKLYNLRKQRGPDLKLVVRETRRTLRYQDDQILHACGATLLVPADTHISRFFSLLESIQGQTYTRSLPEDLEQVLKRRAPVEVKGMISPSAFLDYVHRSLPLLVQPGGAAVLVALEPVPGLNTSQVMTQLIMRRNGDVACHVGGVVYLFLLGCRPNLVELALANVFRLPYTDIFVEHRVYSSHSQIEVQLQNLRQQLDQGLQEPDESIDAPDLVSGPGPAARQDAERAWSVRRYSLKLASGELS